MEEVCGCNQSVRVAAGLFSRPIAARLGVGFLREVFGKVIDNRVEFIVRTVRALVDHVADHYFPAFFSIAMRCCQFGSVASATNLLNYSFAGTVGQICRESKLG